MSADLGTILGVWAHPDDEAFLSAGLMALAAGAGRRVAVVTATNGELGGFDGWSSDRLGVERARELERSLAILGVSEHWMLGHPDGGCSDVPLELGAGEVARAIRAIAPDTILTFGPDGHTGHPDHRAMSAWADAAVYLTGSDARVLHATVPPDFLVDFADIHDRFDVFFAGEPTVTAPEDMAVHVELDGELLDRKVAALLAQVSQTRPLVDALGVDRFRQWVSVEAFRLHAPQPATV